MLPAFLADGEGVILHTLLDLKLIRAAFTLVLIDWHDLFPPTNLVYLVYSIYLVCLVERN